MSFPPPGPPVEPPFQMPSAGEPEHPGQQPGNRRSPVALGALVGVLVFALIAAGFAGWQLVAGDDDGGPTAVPSATLDPTPSPSKPLPTGDAALAAFYGQKLDWQDCERNECATLRVPLDYAKPDGDTVDLQLLKVPAQDQEKRVGALVVNPGGPGGSGVNYAASGSLQFGDTLSDRFDIVGFDPRGVGASDPLECLDTQGLDEVVAFDPDPDSAAELSAEPDRLIAGYGQGCLDRSGDLARHMSTEEVARDLDVLRAALGEPTLNYLGASYGTFIGATYANLFPKNVGRFVLDGAIDPSLSNTELSQQQGQGFETALRAYLKDCVDRGCFLGRTVDEAATEIRRFLDATDAKPLPTDSSRDLTEGLATLGIWLPLYVKSYWPQLTAALKEAIQDGEGDALLGLADAYTSRGADGYNDNSLNALYAVNCLDHNDFVATKDIARYLPAFEKASPTFGRAFAYSLTTCSNWPVKSGEHSTALRAAGAPPIVVVGTTRDPATPLVWAQALAKQLESGTLITRDGDGHTGFNQGNDCVDTAVERWLVLGTQPQADLRC